MAHAKLSASAAHRWMNCPGSINLVEELERKGFIPPDKASDAAAEGTAAHHLAEHCVKDMLAGGWNISADRYRGIDIVVDPESDGTWFVAKGAKGPDAGMPIFTIDDDMIWAVDVFLDHVRTVLESMGATEDGGVPSDVFVEVEAYADLSFLGREDLGGRIDVRITQLMGDMHVIDYKHGRGVPVTPENNPQLMIYGLGGDANLECAPDKVVLTIVQPRCPKNEAVDSWTIPAEDLRSWGRGVLVPAAEASANVDAPHVPGEKQCQWCRAAGHCNASHNLALEVAKSEFDDLPPEPTGEDAKKAVMGMDLDRVLKILSARDFIEAAIKAATARVMAELETGREVPGWKLVPGQSRRTWVKDAEKLLKKKRVPQSITHEKKLRSFSYIEKVESGKYKDLVNELTTKPEGKPSLVPESDKRPALPSTAESDFDDDLLS